MPSINAHSSQSEILFFDDFTSNGLDRSRWNVEVTGPVYNDEQQAYVDSTETIYTEQTDRAEDEANGMLVIQPRYCAGFATAEGKTFDFISGRINTLDKVE